MKFTPDLFEAALAGVKSELDGGRMYYFAGPVPASASAALDMVNDHTQLVMMTESGDGLTGLTFDAPAGNTLAKAAAEEWSGPVSFSGAQDSESTLTPTFFRFCPAGDDGTAAADTPRLQGTIGGPSSSADIKLTDGTTLTDNGTNTRGLALFSVTLSTV